MSHQATNLVRSRQFGSAGKKAVMAVLASYADAEWSTLVGQARLAWEAEVGERTARRYLAEFEEAGLIRREYRRAEEGRGRTSDRIFLLPETIAGLPERFVDGWDQPATPAGKSPGTNRPPAPDQPANERGPTGQGLAGDQLGEDRSVSEKSDTPAGVSFEGFWSVYPRRQAKGAARTAWAKAITKADAADICVAALAFADWVKATGHQFVPHPATWLNQERWDDELPDAGTGPAGHIPQTNETGRITDL